MAEEKQREAGAASPVNSPQAALGVDIGSLLGGLLSGGRSDRGGSEAASPLSEGINAVLRDPDMMAKLPSVIEMLRPMMGESTGGGATEKSATAAEVGESGAAKEAAQEIASPVFKAAGKGRSCHERRVALLCALRPYLNPRRQEAIDYILRMDQMGKLFRQT